MHPASHAVSTNEYVHASAAHTPDEAYVRSVVPDAHVGAGGVVQGIDDPSHAAFTQVSPSSQTGGMPLLVELELDVLLALELELELEALVELELDVLLALELELELEALVELELDVLELVELELEALLVELELETPLVTLEPDPPLPPPPVGLPASPAAQAPLVAAKSVSMIPASR
jgi:hypothetical protein